MKRILILLFLLKITFSFSQFAVIDASVAASVNTLNGNVSITNSKLAKIISQNERINTNLSEIVSLLKEQNNISTDSKNILDEELKAKKTAPNYVFASRELDDAISLKTKILESYNAGKNLIGNFEYLEAKEIDEYLSFAAKSILKANNFFLESRNILTTTSIINPEERLKRIDKINNKLNQILDSFVSLTNQMKAINHSRKSKNSLINLSKN